MYSDNMTNCDVISSANIPFQKIIFLDPFFRNHENLPNSLFIYN